MRSYQEKKEKIKKVRLFKLKIEEETNEKFIINLIDVIKKVKLII